RFNPQEGCIWLEGERMLMLHLAAFAGLRCELIDSLGIETARNLLMRMGHISGAADAALARRAKPEAQLTESFMAGPRLHAIEGMVAVDPVGFVADPETGFHAGEWIWRNSAEVEAHLRAYGLSAEPGCWTLIGCASAYTSACVGVLDHAHGQKGGPNRRHSAADWRTGRWKKELRSRASQTERAFCQTVRRVQLRGLVRRSARC